MCIDKMVSLLDTQDEKTVAMLRKSLDTITMERDAAFISRVRGDIGYFVQSWAICSTLEKNCTCFYFSALYVLNFGDLVRAGRYGCSATTHEEKTARGRGRAV